MDAIGSLGATPGAERSGNVPRDVIPSAAVPQLPLADVLEDTSISGVPGKPSKASFHLYVASSPWENQTTTTTVDDITIKINATSTAPADTAAADQSEGSSSSVVINEIVTTTHNDLHGTSQTTVITASQPNSAPEALTQQQLATIEAGAGSTQDQVSISDSRTTTAVTVSTAFASGTTTTTISTPVRQTENLTLNGNTNYDVAQAATTPTAGAAAESLGVEYGAPIAVFKLLEIPFVVSNSISTTS